MNFLRRLFGSRQKDVAPSDSATEELVLVPIPALVALLLRAEQLKGAPLTESEVLRIRDDAACMSMTIEMAQELEKKRGYPDIAPEFAWSQWQVARLELVQSET